MPQIKEIVDRLVAKYDESMVQTRKYKDEVVVLKEQVDRLTEMTQKKEEYIKYVEK